MQDSIVRRDSTGRAQLPKLPEIKLPYSLAESRYGSEVARLMARKDESVAEEAKKLAAKDFNWTLGYKLGDDPPDTTDQDAFVVHLRKHSQVYLIARGNHWKGWEELEVTPPQVVSRMEERARLVCRQRMHLADQQLATKSDYGDRRHAADDSGEAEVLDISDRCRRDCLDGLARWLAMNPEHDRRLARVTRFVLEQLFLDGGE